MNKILSLFALALLTVSPVQGEGIDSLAVCMLQGDSCMQQYNTFEALRYYQKAYDLAQSQDITRFSMDKDFSMSKPYVPEDKVPRHVRLKLADCHYQRADYRQTAELLKNMPEDSLSHDAFRELALSYQKQGDTDSYIYWASQLLGHYPMDAEIVAGLTLAYAKSDQPQKGVICGLKYSLKDSTNILVNRALADAWFMNRDFTAAAMLYDKLLEQGDSTFNTLYSAGMSHSQTGSLERAYDCLSRALEVSQMQHAGCAFRLGVVCVDTKRYPEGLKALELAQELLKPDTTTMKAITLSQGEGFYLTQHYPEAVKAWKRHLDYNPSSVATCYNIANAYAYLIKDEEQAKTYYQRFLELARQEQTPTPQLAEMMEKAEEMLKYFKMLRRSPARQSGGSAPSPASAP
jgi:tetratricopeptide (TPR) repeat protein